MCISFFYLLGFLIKQKYKWSIFCNYLKRLANVMLSTLFCRFRHNNDDDNDDDIVCEHSPPTSWKDSSE